MKAQIVVTSALFVGLCSGLAVASNSADDYKAAYEAADKARKEAAAVNGEWRDTGKMLKQSKKAADAGDMDKAIKLATKAKAQGEAGYQQAKSQQGKDLTPAYLND